LGRLANLYRTPERDRPIEQWVIAFSFVYGTAFYRPPNPPATQRHEMLRAITRDYKLNMIRIYSAWSYMNPDQGCFDFAKIASEFL
jgi:beta-galactosidase GanA